MDKIIINIILINLAIVSYIKLRQIFALNNKQSTFSKTLLTSDEYKKAVQYNRTCCLYSIFIDIMDVIWEIFSIKNLNWLYSKYFSEIRQGDVLFIVSYFLFNYICFIPFNMFNTFVIKQHYGFNKTSLMTFLKDIILESSIASIFLYLVSHVCFYFILKDHTFFYLYILGFLAILIFLFQSCYMKVIAPLFNKFTDLEDFDLKKYIHELAENVGFKTSKILVMDGSKRSTHSNAFFIGFGKYKNIVFYDTILKKLQKNEIIGVLSHELGHWTNNHNFISLGLVITYLLLYIYLFNHMINIYKGILPLAILILNCNFLFSCISLPLTFFKNWIIRCMEKQADRYAVKMGYKNDLSSALIKLFKENSAAPVNDPLYSCMVHSHPPVEERLELINKEIFKTD